MKSKTMVVYELGRSARLPRWLRSLHAHLIARRIKIAIEAGLISGWGE